MIQPIRRQDGPNQTGHIHAGGASETKPSIPEIQGTIDEIPANALILEAEVEAGRLAYNTEEYITAICLTPRRRTHSYSWHNVQPTPRPSATLLPNTRRSTTLSPRALTSPYGNASALANNAPPNAQGNASATGGSRHKLHHLITHRKSWR